MESQHGFTGTTSEMQTDTRGVPGGVPVGVHSSSQGRGGLFAVLPGLVDHPRHAGRPVVSLSSGTPITTAPHVTSELDKAHRVDHRPHLAPTPNDRATTRRSPPPQRQHPPPVTRRPLARPLPGLQAVGRRRGPATHRYVRGPRFPARPTRRLVARRRVAARSTPAGCVRGTRS